MVIPSKFPLINIHDLTIRAAAAEIVTWQGCKTLRLENGLAIIRDHRQEDACIEVWIGVDGSAYPGVAFRIADMLNYELAYAVPHVSGQWDALQYDPVFHGSNTWQLYCGSSYQGSAQVPTKSWFKLRINFFRDKAAISVNGQSPLVIEGLAHSRRMGSVGLWTFRPAYFRDLRISSCENLNALHGDVPHIDESVVQSWFLESYGGVSCEANGAINLNRYLPISFGEARLSRRFEITEQGIMHIDFGFSDVLSLEIDRQVLFKGENIFKGFADRDARGYVELGKESLDQAVPPGEHVLTAQIQASEGFGWGLMLSARAQGLHWLPVEWG